MKRLGLYIHIPFCVRKCLYCDFCSFPGCDDKTKEEYVKALCKEIMTQGLIFTPKGYLVDTIFIGGGTPSSIPAEKIVEILNVAKTFFTVDNEVEITIEMNPGTVDEEKLKSYKQVGINRLSIGLQSTNDEELKALGRIHKYSEFLEAYSLARKVGFDNINIDIMSALPGQSVESYEETLDKVLALEPEHISAYSLIVEEGTPFYDMDLDLPEEDDERRMYYLTREKLLEKGYVRYEISNYAKADKECKHNVGYWTGKEYLGVGLNAASYYEEARVKNTEDLNEYISGKYEAERTELSIEDLMEEYMFVGLRRMEGISIEGFMNKFGKSIYEIHGEAIEKHVKNGLLMQAGDNIKLTDKGIDVSNYVLADFLLS